MRDNMGPALRAQISHYEPIETRNFFSIATHYEPLTLYTHFYHWWDLARMRDEPHPSPIRRGALLYNIWDTRAEGEFLRERIDACRKAGISVDRLLVDPGFGFGKTDQQNLELLRNLEQLKLLGLPLLVGLSRKRLLGNLTGKSADLRLSAGIAAAVLAVLRGARIIRTHDVAETVDAIRVTQAVI
jgi:hypothetical protein